MAKHENSKHVVGKNADKMSLRFRTSFESKPDKTIKVIAYAFDRHGNLLATSPVRDDLAQLTLDPDQARTARIFLAPERPQAIRDNFVTLELMERLHAYEVTWPFDPDRTEYELLPIPEYLLNWWIFCFCRVRGKVVKPVSIGGITVDLPVCNARVHICEVDPLIWLIPRLPESLVFRLRDDLIYKLRYPRPFPIPLPDPPPFVFDPGIIDPTPENIAGLNRARIELNPKAELPSVRSLGIGEAVMLNPQPLPPREFADRFENLELKTKLGLESPSLEVVRQTLLENVVLIRPFICFWPWIWHYLCRCDEIAVLSVDGQGRFDTSILYFCAGDKPDLYFWVESMIGGSWTTVYHPNPVCCHTYWDYACGSEVTLRVTDPRVFPCGDPGVDLPGLQVAIVSIGENVSIHEIPVDSTASAPHSGTATEGLANGTHPFGGSLEPRVNFSRSALIAMNITHYRWSYRQLTEGPGGTSVADTWHTMPHEVIRHYQVYDSAASKLSSPAYPLGPDPAYPGLDLIRIQPVNAPTGRAEDWTPNVDARKNSASAFFESHLTRGGDAILGAGKYELKFELFKIAPDGTAHEVNFTADGIALKVPNMDAPFGPATVTYDDADDHHRFKNAAGDTMGFRLVLRVDNNPCQAAINQVSVDSASNVAGPCGFIEYANKSTSTATISFIARHPHNFATFTFTTVKGSTGAVEAARDGGQVGQGGLDAKGFINTPATGLYTKSVRVSDLLDANGVSCDQAAFGETLDVTAMATDGWSQLSYLDRRATPMAFALEPKPPSPPA
jgi:hypothetical protein